MNWSFPKGIQLQKEKQDFAPADDILFFSYCSEVGVSKGGFFPPDHGVNNSSISLIISGTIADGGLQHTIVQLPFYSSSFISSPSKVWQNISACSSAGNSESCKRELGSSRIPGF